MKLSQFKFKLPEERIAQEPARFRDECRLMVIHAKSGIIEHRESFRDILNYVVSEEENVCPIEGHGRFRFKNPTLVRSIDTYYSDVDINGHINSIKYIEHILNLLPKERFANQQIRRIEIAYKNEAYLGDKLCFYVQDGQNDKEIEIEVRKNESEVACQAKIYFH